MCHCLSFLVHPTVSQRWASWRRALLRLVRRIRSYNGPFTGLEVHHLTARGKFASYAATGKAGEHLLPERGAGLINWTMGTCISTTSNRILAEKRKQDKGKDTATETAGPNKRVKSRPKAESALPEGRLPRKISINGASNVACLFTQQGRKGLNQDAMIVCEAFNSQEDTVFCGVFDGHGPYGHLVAQSVRDSLPPKLASNWQAVSCANAKDQILSGPSEDLEDSIRKGHTKGEGSNLDPKLFSLWKESFLNAYMVMDKELRGKPSIDCYCSGTTAVTLVKQGNDVIIGNVGDSRAILGTKSDDGSLIAIQLTVDLKPNLPQEAERIRQCKGRVFALHDEPEVHRVWLPHDDSPGLAMARAFGDFCLKNFGVIAIPEVTHCRLSERDQFIVLATDGIWDVLSNEQVVDIVSSVAARPFAARAVVEMAVRAWRTKYPMSKVDDCAVVCLFTEDILAVSSDSVSKKLRNATSIKQHDAVSQKFSAGEWPAIGTEGKTFQLRGPPSNIQGFGTASQSHSLSRLTEGASLPVAMHNLRRAGTAALSKHDSGSQILIHGESSYNSSQDKASTKPNDKQENDKLATECLLGASQNDDWTALEGVTRVNSLVSLPRFTPDDTRTTS